MAVMLRFEDCSEQRALKKGNRSEFLNYGILSIGKQRGEIVAVPSQYSRSEYLSQIGKAAKRVDLLELAKKTADEELAKLNQQLSINSKVLGLIEQDSNAIYVAVIATTQDTNGSKYQRAGVLAMTLIRGLPVNSSIYAEYSGTRFAELLSRQRVILNTIVKDNP